MKTFLQNFIERKKAEMKDLQERSDKSTSVDEVRSIGETLTKLRDEIDEAEKELAKIDDDGNSGEGEEGERHLIPNGIQLRGGDPLASYGIGGRVEEREAEPFSSMEYRKAFKEYVQRGTPIPKDVITRAGGDEGITTSADLGAIIPITIMNEFIKDVSKVRGNIYSKVRKLNVQGGVKFPISKLKAKFKWITETTVSEKQKAGDIKDFVEFSFNIGEIRVAQTLLSQVVSLSLFEQEIVKIMLEAYLEEMDRGIIYGTGSGQLLGITKDARVTNVVEFTEEEFSDWTAWRKKLFAEIPLSKRGTGEFLFPSSTVEANLLTMKDKNDRPVFKEATEIEIGNDGGKFYGRQVTLVEPDVIPDLQTANAGDVVGIYWVPNDYAINTNMEFGMKRYFDEDTNEWINKGLTIVDGKILDTSGCYIIKKKASTPSV